MTTESCQILAQGDQKMSILETKYSKMLERRDCLKLNKIKVEVPLFSDPDHIHCSKGGRDR